MSTTRTEKVQQLHVINTWVKELQTLVVFNYSGLSVAAFEILRAKLTTHHAQLGVFKNRLFKLALREHKFRPLMRYLTGANAFVMTQEPNSALPHVLYRFSREHSAVKLNCAVYDQKLLVPAELLALASLPTKSELLAMLGGALVAPVSLLVATLQAVVSLRSKS